MTETLRTWEMRRIVLVVVAGGRSLSGWHGNRSAWQPVRAPWLEEASPPRRGESTVSIMKLWKCFFFFLNKQKGKGNQCHGRRNDDYAKYLVEWRY